MNHIVCSPCLRYPLSVVGKVREQRKSEARKMVEDGDKHLLSSTHCVRCGMIEKLISFAPVPT
jgi:hypothetical protein